MSAQQFVLDYLSVCNSSGTLQNYIQYISIWASESINKKQLTVNDYLIENNYKF